MTRLDRRTRWFALVTGLSMLIVCLSATPSSARVASSKWVNGTLVSSNAITKGNQFSILGDKHRKKCILRSYATVQFKGDYVYVRDECKDGIAAVAQITWARKGVGHRRYCVNRKGAGKVVRCNFNWPEGGKWVKEVVAGLEKKPKEKGQWQWGTYVVFRD